MFLEGSLPIRTQRLKVSAFAFNPANPSGGIEPRGIVRTSL